MNVVVLSGFLSQDPEQRELPSGSQLTAYEVTVPRPSERSESVPVVLIDTPPVDLYAGDAVVVVGRVRRRFFRAGGGTQSRTEVTADIVLPATGRYKKRVAKAMLAAQENIRLGTPTARTPT